ncbi:alpha/beta hydrolase [Nocardia zapadnayensis]|uniref:alpha/beta fold hydrolase n=1 Tax=Nocardia rhamnosiphila TaxID=426716 RepID=UPI0022466148|nr:alpha/beta hydrolase [Nocardia zapadnayensis]MCX0275209.1 alpha/beta hydrolase [Nocardia zapadnayensis]
MPRSTLQYTELPARAVQALDNLFPPEEEVAARVAEFADVVPREPDADGATEVLDGVTFTHHFTEVDGDMEVVGFHWAECGEGEPIVFLHGIPDSWYQWYHQMASLSGSHRCIGIDLKGYGQSEKAPGDYRHEAAAEQLVRALDAMGVDRFNLVTHDRGTVQGDYIAANHPDRVLRYGRGEQHLHHFHPELAPQGPMFAEAPSTGLMDDPRRFVVSLYAWVGKIRIADAEMRRVIQEFSYKDCHRATPRYFNSATFRQEWIDRRTRLLPAWTCPVLIMQGYDSKTQPREFYEAAREYIPNAKNVSVRYFDAGHFWSLETPADVTDAIRQLLLEEVP